MRKDTYATLAPVGTNVKSVNHSWFDAVAVKSCFAGSGYRVPLVSGLIVFNRFNHMSPSIPRERISRAV